MDRSDWRRSTTLIAAAAAMTLACWPGPAAEPSTPTKLRFRHHFIDTDLPGRSFGQTALVDLDRDGKLDFITGRSGGDVYWFRFQAPGRWERHLLGRQSPSDVGGAALDVDGDGRVDFVTGGAWYRHPGEPRS